jgi:hypothetical protein
LSIEGELFGHLCWQTVMRTKIFHSLDIVLSINFVISVLFLVAGTLLSVSEQYSLFELNQDLYGEFISNFKITMVYVALSELLVCAYCFFSKQMQYFILVGFFLVLMVGSIHFYSRINNIELDDNLSLFFLYTGISHVLFGVMADFKNKNIDNSRS